MFASSNACRFFRANGEEIRFSGGKGAVVTDTEGRDYVDFVLGCGPVVLGHGHPRFAARLAQAVTGAIHLPGYTAAHAGVAAHYLSLIGGDRAIGFFKHSSDAMTAAARLAAWQTGRLGVVRCGYLGWHDLLIGDSPGWHEPLTSPHRGQRRETGPMRGIGPAEPIYDWLDLSPATLDRHLAAHPGQFGVLMIDAHQMSMTTPEAMAEAVATARRHGLRVVADETKTAGRVAPLGLLAQEGIEGDLIVLGKAIANGAPSAILIGGGDLQQGYAACKISGTHCKELIGLYATAITRDIMAEEDGYHRLRQVGRAFAGAFDAAARAAGLSRDLWAEPLFGGSSFELRFSQPLLDDRALRDQLVRLMADAGVLLMQGHPSFVSLSHETLDWDRLSAQMLTALRAWQVRARPALREGVV